MFSAKNYKLITFTIGVFMTLTCPSIYAKHIAEDEVKVAFVYNFIRFIDWPQEKTIGPNDPIIIGVIGPEFLLHAFESLKDKQAKNRDIVTKSFVDLANMKKNSQDSDSQWNKRIEMLKTCHVVLLFPLYRQQTNSLSDILDELKGLAVLTIGESSGFLEKGGIINFIKEEGRIQFEINAIAARKSNLDISSKLLRVAKRVIQ